MVDLQSRARRRNIGWRIDYVFTKKEFKNQLKDAFIQPDVMGSDTLSSRNCNWLENQTHPNKIEPFQYLIY